MEEEAPPPPPPTRDEHDDPPDVDADNDERSVVHSEDGGSLDAVHEILRLSQTPGQHPRTTGVLTTAAGRLREVLTRDGGVDGHEVLHVMVSSLEVRVRVTRTANTPLFSRLFHL
jgi:hypothetical protein